MLPHHLGSVQTKIERCLYTHNQGDESIFKMSRLELKKKKAGLLVKTYLLVSLFFRIVII